MPAAKRSKSSTSRSSRFKEPAALKRLNKSLDAAQDALKELRKDSGRGGQDLYKDLRTFVSSARRDTGKLARTLAKDFDQAQKTVRKAGTSSSRSTSTRGKTSRSKSGSSSSRRGSSSSRSSSSSSRSGSSRSGSSRRSGSRSS